MSSTRSPSNHHNHCCPHFGALVVRLYLPIIITEYRAGLASKSITLTKWGAILSSRLDVLVRLTVNLHEIFVSLGGREMKYTNLVYEPSSRLVFSSMIIFEKLPAILQRSRISIQLKAKPILLKTHGEYEAIIRHFEIGPDFNCLRQRVNLFPGSFTDFWCKWMIQSTIQSGWCLCNTCVDLYHKVSIYYSIICSALILNMTFAWSSHIFYLIWVRKRLYDLGRRNSGRHLTGRIIEDKICIEDGKGGRRMWYASRIFF